MSLQHFIITLLTLLFIWLVWWIVQTVVLYCRYRFAKTDFIYNHSRCPNCLSDIPSLPFDDMPGDMLVCLTVRCNQCGWSGPINSLKERIALNKENTEEIDD